MLFLLAAASAIPFLDFDQDGYASFDDCDDTNPFIYPGAIEICDGIDNDCDGIADDGTGYADADGDSYGVGPPVPGACGLPGFATRGGDCNDSSVLQHPNASELCDGVDNDCDGFIDEGVGTMWFPDADGDGFGGPVGVVSCVGGPGMVTNPSDCNDADWTVYPGAPEVCDARDNDCDGQVDEDAEETAWYRDVDGDGYGAGEPVLSCFPPNARWSTVWGDCDDTNPAAHPGLYEVPGNGVDDDCDPATSDQLGPDDTGSPPVDPPQPLDRDGDGFARDEDCDDTDPTVYPGALEVCGDPIDQDCDGVVECEDIAVRGCAVAPAGALGMLGGVVLLAMRRRL
ncbi:MAG: putative metal-binding motif-containing protein [Alphaproteobacteria bacterium]|nr:putative metal-binding motif-containing protein [Alphaproteobacteria bacterium]